MFACMTLSVPVCICRERNTMAIEGLACQGLACRLPESTKAVRSTMATEDTLLASYLHHQPGVPEDVCVVVQVHLCLPL